MKPYVISWTTICFADNLIDAISQAVSQLQNPQINQTVFQVTVGERLFMVDAEPVFRGLEVKNLETWGEANDLTKDA